MNITNNLEQAAYHFPNNPVVFEGDNTISYAELKAFLKKQLSRFKVPKEFITVDSLPKNNAGKILKRDLRNLITP